MSTNTTTPPHHPPRPHPHLPPRLRLLFVFLALSLVILTFWKQRQASKPNAPGRDLDALTRQLESLLAREEALDQTLWAPDLLAQQAGSVIEDLWDELNASTNRLNLLAQWPIEITPPTFATPSTLPHGLRAFASLGPGNPWTAADWAHHLHQASADGWILEQLEFRHEQFDPDPAGQPAHSRFYFVAHLTQPAREHRAAFRGHLTVHWAPAPPTAATPPRPTLRHVDARELSLVTRHGPLPFTPWLEERVDPPPGTFFIDPLLLRDLDGDGRSEIILAAANRVFRLEANGQFASAPLCRYPPGLLFTAVLEDFDRDGAADLLLARFEGLILYRGSPTGTFDLPGRLVWAAEPRLKYGQVLTCGDVDGDGDLDVWLGQYKPPYARGQMPTPWHDANDGHPSWLLLNDGRGNLSDATAAAGLTLKRHRRTYSASFADLDADGDLDLAVVSDFAGVDFYANDGHGCFQDVTATWAPVRHAFGMAHTLADFDADGRADFLMMGMQCPTPQRLGHLRLQRPGFQSMDAHRGLMIEGNRLFRGRPDGGFAPSPLNPTIARSGWSWGVTAPDLDLDGFPDAYISTGHETHASVRDYETEFWRHDIYVAGSQEDPMIDAYFRLRAAETRDRGWSYGGWEKNKLFLNRHGQSFLETGHLLGLALEADCRNVASDDLDADGRPDLLVTTFEAWPLRQQTLRIYRNQLEPAHWIGLRLLSAEGRSPLGAEIIVTWPGGKASRHLLTGDSHRVQHAPVALFGLGPHSHVEQLDIRWPGGRRTTLPRPAPNRYHTASP